MTLRQVRVPDGRGLSFAPLGALPDLDWVPIGLLRVDPTYQRSTGSDRSTALIRRIAAEFSWAKFQPLSTARRDGGLYAVIDGQHRLAGAVLRGDIPNLPCYVLPRAEMAAEAAAFMALNRDRVQVHQTALLKARVVAGDRQAREVVAICARAGVVLVSSSGDAKAGPGRTQAAGRIESLVERFGGDVVERALVAVRQAYDGRKIELRGPLIAAVALVLANNPDVSDLARLAAVLAAVPPDGWILRGQLRRAEEGGTLGAGVAFAVVTAFRGGAMTVLALWLIREPVDMGGTAR